LDHPEDVEDHNLPLMYWYALEPLTDVDPAQALEVATQGKVPLVWQFTVRKLVTDAKPENLERVVTALDKLENATDRGRFLRAVVDGLKGRPRVAMPANWPAVFAKLGTLNDPEVRQLASSLAVTFGDPKALASVRKLLATRDAPAAERVKAIETLAAAGDKELAPLLHEALGE